jgi:hypothetical protein
MHEYAALFTLANLPLGLSSNLGAKRLAHVMCVAPEAWDNSGVRRAPRGDRSVASNVVIIVRSPLKVSRRLSHRCDATELVIVTRNRSINSVVLVAKHNSAIYVVVESEALTATQLIQDQ